MCVCVWRTEECTYVCSSCFCARHRRSAQGGAYVCTSCYCARHRRSAQGGQPREGACTCVLCACKARPLATAVVVLHVGRWLHVPHAEGTDLAAVTGSARGISVWSACALVPAHGYAAFPKEIPSAALPRNLRNPLRLPALPPTAATAHPTCGNGNYKATCAPPTAAPRRPSTPPSSTCSPARTTGTHRTSSSTGMGPSASSTTRWGGLGCGGEEGSKILVTRGGGCNARWRL